MKGFIALLILGVSSQAFAHTEYYCKLENVPLVQAAVKEALKEAQTDSNQVGIKGGPIQFTLHGVGDGFDYFNTDLLVYSLDGLGKDNALSIAVKVQYNAVLAKQYHQEDPDAQDIICKDTQEVNAERVFLRDHQLTAVPYRFQE